MISFIIVASIKNFIIEELKEKNKKRNKKRQKKSKKSKKRGAKQGMVKQEKSCGAIVFRKENKKILYLILYKKASEHYRESWDFPKGNVEKNETEQQVAAREIKEETGIDELNFISSFKETIKLFYRKEGKLVFKIITFLLAETRQEKVKLSFEHDSYKWASYEEAMELLTHKNSKEILTKANNLLKEKLKQKALQEFSSK